jgi:hypothetical protein
MGLLDDAIREHLELKKRSGASDDEIRRLENEALGDPRNRPAPAPAEAAVDAPPEDEEPPVVAAPSGEAAPPVPAEAAVEAPPAEALDPELAPPVSRELRAPEPAPDPPARGEPRDFEADDIFADDAPAPTPAEADEDVLEETPDFLQETPEHDRLWFEQKPPRDFDFGA